MKNNVKLIKQKEGSQDCGIKCIEMVLDFFGRNDLLYNLNKMKVKKLGIYTSEITKFFQENGFETEIIFFSTDMFTLKDENCSQMKVRESLQKVWDENKGDRKWSRLFLETMDLGGKVKIKIPSATDILNNISRDSLIIVNFTTRFLHNYEIPKTNLHYALITGIDDKYVYVNDSANLGGGKFKHKIRDFMYSIHSIASKGVTCGSLIVVKNKK